jgi:NhaP-type Na+/H+ or K+/H+ antiporter
VNGLLDWVLGTGLGCLIGFAMGYGAAWLSYWVYRRSHREKRGR